MKRLSLQWRITLMTAALIGVTCVLMNCLIGYSGKRYMDAIGSGISAYSEIESGAPDAFDPQSKQPDDELTIIISGAQAAFGVTNWYITAAVTLIGGLFITILSFIMIMTVYGRFFRLYLYTAIAPVPLSTFAGEPTQNVGKSFIKSYAAVCLEGAIIVLACIIFSLFAAAPPAIDPNAAAVTQVWSYIGELVFNMLVLVGAVKMADRVVREMMGL